MTAGRIDQRLYDKFDRANANSTSVESAHTVAASIDGDAAQELLRETPSVGHISYLSELEVLVADVERDGFHHLVESPNVHALSDGNLMFNLPEPLNAEPQISLTAREVVRADAPLFEEYEGKGVTIAIMDTGVHAGHDCFGGRVREQISCVSGDNGIGDMHGHGTHVAGTVAGAEFGVAGEAELLDLRVFGPSGGASTSSILNALNLCVQKGVDIVNMSLGSDWPSLVLDQAVNTVAQRGVMPCIAAGNSGPSASTINSPASAQFSIAVAATNHTGQTTSFSSRGPNPFAPWEKPTLAAFGLNVVSASHTGGACTMSGTSMATPAVAGMLACLLEMNRDFEFAPIFSETLLRDAAEPRGQSRTDVGHGYVTLGAVDRFLKSSQDGLGALKKKGKHVPSRFFEETVLQVPGCSTQRILHTIALRNDGTVRLELHCPDQPRSAGEPKPNFEQVILENWKHERITTKQYVSALRMCGGCRRRGLVPIKATPIDLPQHQPHDRVVVGCLYCGGKGERKIPNTISSAWGQTK